MNTTSLAAHLERIAQPTPGPGTVWQRQALVVLADPQSHIDALVAAGVLVADPVPWTQAVAYYLPIHVHEWRVVKQAVPVRDWVDPDPGHLLLACECGASAKAPNRLPIEVPS